MKALPHQYSVKVEGQLVNNITVSADNLPTLQVSPPKQFDGPGDQWSPEELLMASIGSCLVLSFRAISKASKFEWISVKCESQGDLENVNRKIQFTRVRTKAILVIPKEQNAEKAEQLLNKAEETCFISNSLSCESLFECEIQIDQQ